MEAVKVAAWQYLEPVVTFTGEALIFNVIPTATTLLGAATIIVGALLTSESKIVKDKTHRPETIA